MINKRLTKTVLIISIVIAAIVRLLLTFYGVLWILRAVMYKESMSLREYVCDIPALGDGFVPQGICYSDDKELYIMTGYNEHDTEMYLVKNNKPKSVRLLDSDGKRLKGHGGGVACTKDYVYIANEHALTYYSLDALINAGRSGVKPLGVKYVDNRAAFVFSNDSELFVGEFYRAGNYETETAHHYKTPKGDENKAIISHYALESSGR